MHHHLPRLKSSRILGVPLLTIAVLAAAPQPPEPQAQDVSADRLARERLQVADHGYELALRQYQAGQADFSLVSEWARRQAEAHFDMKEPQAERVAFLEGYVKQLQNCEQLTRKRSQAGLTGQLEVLGAQYLRLEGKMWLAKAREQ